MCGINRQDIPLVVKVELVDAHLTIESMYRLRVVVAVIYDIVFPVDIDDGVVSGTMYGFVGIGGENLPAIGERSHRPFG